MRRAYGLLAIFIFAFVGPTASEQPECVATSDVNASYEDGVLRLPAWPALHLGPNLDWPEDKQHPSFLFQVHNLMWLIPTLAEDPNEGFHVLQDWVLDGSMVEAAWSDHTAALRLKVLTCAWEIHRPEWLSTAIADHAEHAIKSYAGPWNHGIDQDLALLRAGCSMEEEEWITTARQRLLAAIPQVVAPDGAGLEQAIGYAHYTYKQLGWIEDTFAACGLTPPKTPRDRMPAFLAHATQPNGQWVPLGDTPQIAAEPFPQPGTTLRSFPEAGYAFWRDTWGSDARYLSLRFGPGRAVHGHNDHTSITYFDGEPVIVDGGFDGYSTPLRSYLQSPAAHNVVTAEDSPRRFLWDATTRLVEHSDNRFVAEDRPYAGVTRQRRVTLTAQGLHVVDHLTTSGRPLTFTQRWHLAPGFETDGYVATKGARRFLIEHRDGEVRVIRDVVGVDRTERQAAPTILVSLRGSDVTFETIVTRT